MDNALIAVFALLVNAALGGPRSLYEASGLIRIGRIPAKLLRDREAGYVSTERAPLLIAYAICLAIVAGVAASALCKDNLKFLEVVLVAALLPVRSVFDRLLQIKTSLAADDLASARRALEGTVWKHHVLLDAHGVARAGIELMAVTFADKILLPLVWYVVVGLPGLFVCKTITLMREQLPAVFNVEANVNKMLLFIPAVLAWVVSRLASMVWIVATVFISSVDIGTLLGKFAGRITALSALPYLIFSVATVMGLSLAGPTSAYVAHEWLGDGSPKPTPADVGKALTLFGLSLLFLFLLLSLFL